ncbi:tyrosine-type recombinase/integrase [Xylanivirga thermophila]|uniref:tyrosine-type recombinase/integrase n=1 Tax=Xylanivirga thermophila TaxID=2496273 RepID=UPI00101C00F9|nr:tyrosine-type recombinase/integrase [Xylanivirga thermophila]
MAQQKDYYTVRYQTNIEKLRNVLNDLPPFCREFFRGIENNTSILTRVNYAYDLRLFFEFLTNEMEDFSGLKSNELTLDHLNMVGSTHIEMFLEYITFYTKTNDDTYKEYQNSECGKARKLSAIRSLFSYFFKKEKLEKNIAELVEIPKIYEKPIIRLEIDEVARLLDLVESGEGLTDVQKRYHQYTRTRDLAILTLFLGTGIRISECVGLNASDIDFDVNGFKITRKGGNEVILYFGDEVRETLLDYLEERKNVTPLPGHEDALFLSLQKRRISNRAVQNLVKKYSQYISPLKKISPHKLRSTYGTTLYRQTGDIYLVADVLGHKDVNTTKKHYAAISDEQRRKAARIVKLRDDE